MVERKAQLMAAMVAEKVGERAAMSVSKKVATMAGMTIVMMGWRRVVQSVGPMG